MHRTHLDKVYSLLFWGIVVALVVLAGTKAASVGFTHDESYSYLHFTQDSFIDIISMKNSFSNNHILNSLLMKYSEMILGNDEWALRLPNLMALILSCLGIYQILREQSNALQLLGLALFMGVNQQFEYYSLARGYGLSTAFIIWSTYFAKSFLEKQSWKDSVGFHLCALLAGLSHFTTLPFYAASGIALFIIQFRTSKHQKGKPLKKLITPILISVVFLYEPLRRISNSGQFDNGGKDGVLDTLTSLASFLLDNQFSNGRVNLAILAFLLFTLIWYFYQQEIMKTKDLPIALHFTSVAFPVLIALLFLMNLIAGFDYPIGRFALFIYPLIALHLTMFIAWALPKDKMYFEALVIVAFTLWSARFYSRHEANLFWEWGYDRHSEQVLLDLEEKIQPREDDHIEVNIDWVFEPSLNYYRIKNDLTWLVPLNRETQFNRESGLQYRLGENLENFSNRPKTIIGRYQYPSTTLFGFDTQ